jgi:hypothetical protein
MATMRVRAKCGSCPAAVLLLLTSAAVLRTAPLLPFKLLLQPNTPNQVNLRLSAPCTPLFL